MDPIQAFLDSDDCLSFDRDVTTRRYVATLIGDGGYLDVELRRDADLRTWSARIVRRGEVEAWAEVTLDDVLALDRGEGEACDRVLDTLADDTYPR